MARRKPSEEDLIVERYLRGLRDPSSLVDQAAVDAAEKELAETDSPLERVKIRQRIVQLKNPQVPEEDFIGVVKKWAEVNGISAEALQAEGVPPAVLRAAGMTLTRATTKAGTPRKRRPRTSPDEVRKKIPADEPFTIQDVSEKTGASRGLVRRVVTEMLDAGDLQIVEPVDTDTPGRAPTTYQVVDAQ